MIRVALISEHASPLAWLGGADSGGQNVYVGQVAKYLAARGHHVDVFTRRDRPELPDEMRTAGGVRLIHVPAGPPTAPTYRARHWSRESERGQARRADHGP